MTTYTDILLHDISNNYFIPYGLINRLGDVDISNPTTGQNLTYDGATGKWKNTSTTATVAWGGVTGTLSDQTDLTNALNGKQDTLVSGTNIKTINNTSLLGSGDISVLQNTATGTASVTILGNPTNRNYALNVGYLSFAQSNYSTAVGYQAEAKEHSTAIGYHSNVNTYSAIQLGYGTNDDAKTLSVGFYDSSNPTNYQLLEGTTGLIPDARISSNIARTSAIPTQASDISAADTTLSNVSSIDSNSAVQTALDGKADTSLSNLSATGKTVIDGQWVSANEDIISSSTSLNGSTALPKRVATIPNDGKVYMGIFRGRAETGTTSGSVIRVQLTGNVLGMGFYIGSARTRSSSAVECQGTVIIPIKGVASGSTNLDIARSTNNTGNLVSLTLIGYRRVGTNS